MGIVYRVLQEALTNTMQHAPGADVHVRVRSTTEGTWLSVHDDGPGPGARTERRYGMVGLRERVALAGGTLESKRRSAEGSAQRRALLAAAGIHAPTTAPIGVSTEDMLDACAAAWTAHRVKNGQARSFPEEPQTFTDGIPSAIHV